MVFYQLLISLKKFAGLIIFLQHCFNPFFSEFRNAYIMPGLEGVWPSPQSRKDKSILNWLRNIVHKTIICSRQFWNFYCLSLAGGVASLEAWILTTADAGFKSPHPLKIINWHYQQRSGQYIPTHLKIYKQEFISQKPVKSGHCAKSA